VIDVNTLNQLAKESEIDEFTLLREYLQIHFLDKFYRSSKLKKTYFKGGTAIRLLFGSSRFSEDLDFTAQLELSIIRSILNDTVRRLSSEFPEISIKDVKTIEGYSAKLYLPTELSRQSLTIKLDFSYRESAVESMVSPVETKLPIGTISLVEHLSAKEILAEKVRALLTRRKGRDLFDVWYLLSKKTVLDDNLVQKKPQTYKKKFLFEELISAIEKWSDEDIDQDLKRFLPVSDRKIILELKRLVLEKLDNKTKRNI
jgi:predicted nucleotidyltransferase component of viral defense system